MQKLSLYTDINECGLGLDNCQQTCTNTPGSYNCSCLSGFELEGFSNCTGNELCVQLYMLAIVVITLPVYTCTNNMHVHECS